MERSTDLTLNPGLHQWFTPSWAAEAIIEQEFGWLRPGHRLVEPSCGDGSFLCAVPDHVEAIGFEIDPRQAQEARVNSGRTVIEGDFLKVDLDGLGMVDAVVGNPPFDASVVAGFLERSAQMLVDGGQVGFILPAYIFQTSSKVEMLSKHFSIRQSLLPRNLFPGLKLPLVFATFVKEQQRRLFGFLLYREAQDIAGIDKRWKAALVRSRDNRGSWFTVVSEIVQGLGGEAELSEIYRAIEGKRPTGNENWREKVRQVVQRRRHFTRTGRGRYARNGFVTPSCVGEFA